MVVRVESGRGEAEEDEEDEDAADMVAKCREGERGKDKQKEGQRPTTAHRQNTNKTDRRPMSICLRR